jgi:hypothetical protein
VALAGGHGLAWVQLTSQRQHAPITLTLGAEGTLRGRLVEPGGRPIEGAKIKVFGIDPVGRGVDNGLGTENRLNLIWSGFPLGARTDADGRLTISGLPRDRTVTLVLTEPSHERLVAFAATTDAPQPENVWRFFRQGKAEESRQPVHTGAFVLVAKRSDHVLSGRVVFEADGKPAAGARVMRDRWTDVKVDDDGRYRIEKITSGPLEVHAIADHSDAAPLDITLEIPEQPKQIERDLVLARALIVIGRVVDGTTGQGVEKATIRFDPKFEHVHTPSIFGFSRETDADGRFRLSVPAGSGTVHLQTAPPSYPPLRAQSPGEPPDERLTREVKGQAGQTVKTEDFRLVRVPGVVLRVMNKSDLPVANARVEIRDMNRLPGTEPGRTDAQGRYEVAGLAPGQITILDISSDNPPLGGVVEIDTERGRDTSKELEVRLEPLVTLSGASSTRMVGQLPAQSFTSIGTSTILGRAIIPSACPLTRGMK